jgi:hypothetical protein
MSVLAFHEKESEGVEVGKGRFPRAKILDPCKHLNQLFLGLNVVPGMEVAAEGNQSNEEAKEKAPPRG